RKKKKRRRMKREKGLRERHFFLYEACALLNAKSPLVEEDECEEDDEDMMIAMVMRLMGRTPRSNEMTVAVKKSIDWVMKGSAGTLDFLLEGEDDSLRERFIKKLEEDRDLGGRKTGFKNPDIVLKRLRVSGGGGGGATPVVATGAVTVASAAAVVATGAAASTDYSDNEERGLEETE
ncbi:hypothetical protein PMAYCL1PPCAC_23979, partial [Pristionchus mayeri]